MISLRSRRRAWVINISQRGVGILETSRSRSLDHSPQQQPPQPLRSAAALLTRRLRGCAPREWRRPPPSGLARAGLLQTRNGRMQLAGWMWAGPTPIPRRDRGAAVAAVAAALPAARPEDRRRADSARSGPPARKPGRAACAPRSPLAGCAAARRPASAGGRQPGALSAGGGATSPWPGSALGSDDSESRLRQCHAGRQ
jgi:hypothetical protein